MHYVLSCPNRADHFLQIEMFVPNLKGGVVEVCLPAWRPGRYELGNFAKNIRDFEALLPDGTPLPFKKVASHRWAINAGSAKAMVLRYEYHARQLDAGSTYVDNYQVYVNPVNCCMYLPERMDEPCTIELDIDAKVVATALDRTGDGKLQAANFQELADGPFFASNTMQYHVFEQSGAVFHLWFQGEARPNMKRIEQDFGKFITVQHKAMGGFPFSEYHFLFQVPHFKAYHGVEHQNSTVIVLGPGYDLMEPHFYKELMGISSHELFHAWNVKAIRPAEMMPYDFSRENYSRLGYVAEGVTTYYGDLFLLRSGFFAADDFLELLAQHVQRHFHNFGRLNYSVGDSSFDTWLDGYVQGVPHRKLSIYSDGALLAFIADVAIRKATNSQRSLDDAMKLLYDRFGKTGTGYTEDDYFAALEAVSATSFGDFRASYFDSAADYGVALREALDWLGLTLQSSDAANTYETDFGFKTGTDNAVSAVHPLGPASAAGIAQGDIVLGINGYRLKDDLKAWCRYFRGEEVQLDISKSGRVETVLLSTAETPCYVNYRIAVRSNASAAQKAAFKSWVG